MIGFFSHVIFYLTRLTYLYARSFIWWLSDYHTVFGSYETSAHVEKIVCRSKINIFDSVRPYHFLGTHEKFDEPEIVLADDVVLMCVTRECAVFLQLPKSIWHYTADKAAFCWITLFKEATKTITMPLSSLHKLADKMGDIKTPSMLISNEGRCGSTLLCNLMHYSNRKVLALSEPDPFQCVQDMMIYRKEMGKDYERLVRSVSILSFKPVKGAEAIVIKVRLTAMQIMDYIATTSPEIKHVYIRRKNLLKTVQSWERAFEGAAQMKMLQFLARYNLLKFLMLHVFPITEEGRYAYDAAFKHLNMKNPFEAMLPPWSNNVLAYTKCSKKFDIFLVVYEELMANPEHMLRKIFGLLKNVQPETIDIALKEGLKGDSQKNTPLSMTELTGKATSDYTPEIKKRVDAYLDAVGLPHLD